MILLKMYYILKIINIIRRWKRIGKLNGLDIFKVEEDGNHSDTNTITKRTIIVII